jgi:hypothetical protein
MGLDIWFAEDIRNALLAANEASAATAAVIAEMGVSPSTSPSTGSGRGSGQAMTDSTDLLTVSLRAYREGYKAALATVALAFGIAPQAIALRQAQDKALRQAQDKALRQAQDKALRQAQDETVQLGRKSEVTYLSPGVRSAEEREKASLQTLGSGEGL